jgi:flagellar basal-body rod modification protein FlgD
MTTVAANPAESIYAALGARTDKKSASVMNEAENRFLTLLTTQLKNQDPLNPLDNAQLTSQLAQISTVNGIEKLNATLQKLLSGMDDSRAMEAAALVNRGVLVPGASMTLGEQGGIGGFELATAADEATVTIKDGSGLVVRTLNLGALAAGIHPFVWDGKADSGAQAATGNYSYSISAKSGANTSTPTALAYGLVQSVTRNASGLTLDVGTLGAYTLADVKQIL